MTGSATPANDARIPLAFRVGITGARCLAPAMLPPLRARLDAVLRAVQARIKALAVKPAVRDAYAPGAPRLRLLSPLAEGADRLAAEAARALGYTLEAPLPFAAGEYARDFGDNTAPFDALLGTAATVFALDGVRGEYNDRSYQAVGRLVARNADLLIAIWDGNAPKGCGGTGDIVPFAAGAGVPVWWIHATNPAADPALIESLAALRQPATAPAGQAALNALDALLERAISVPVLPPVQHSAALAWIADHLRRWCRSDADPLTAYLAEGEPAPRWLWKCYAKFLNAIAPKPKLPERKMLPAEGPQETWWDRLYARADRLSLAYGDRYRSSYVLIFGLAATGLAFAAAELALPHVVAPYTTVVEFAALAGIGVFVFVNHFFRFHERWIGYRLLAELCRKQHVLAPLGGALPAWRVGRAIERDAAREEWLAWYFAAAMRAAPFPAGSASFEALLRAQTVGASLIDEQADYHAMRHARGKSAAHWLGKRGEWLFLATIVLEIGKFAVLLATDWRALPSVTEVLAIVLPSVSAAFFGIRAYAEFELLLHQSDRMRHVMDDARKELGAIDLKRPLASQSLAALFDDVAVAMLEDVQGWSLLFRTKVLESS